MLRIVAMEDDKWFIALRRVIYNQKGAEVRRLAELNLRFDGCRFCAIEFARIRGWLSVSPQNFECPSHGASARRVFAHSYPKMRRPELKGVVTDEDAEVAHIMSGRELQHIPRRGR